MVRFLRAKRRTMWVVTVCLIGAVGVGRAQEDPMTQVHSDTPAKKSEGPPKVLIQGADNVVRNATGTRDAEIRVDVNLVLVPVSVTDPRDRLVTGLDKENFNIFDNNSQQTVKTFSTEDAPVTMRDRV